MATDVTCKLALKWPNMAALVPSKLLTVLHAIAPKWLLREHPRSSDAGETNADLQRSVKAAPTMRYDAGHLW